MKVLVTGAAGFIGSMLCEYLLEHGYDVTGVDNESTGSRANLEKCFGSTRFEYVKADLLDNSIQLPGPWDFIVHLAAMVGVKTAIEKGVLVMEDNVAMTWTAMTIAEECDAKFVYISSSEVYGETTDQPLYETYPCILPSPTDSRFAYTAGKVFDEYLVLGRKDSVKGVVIRPFNTVGARQHRHYGAVLPNFVEACLNKKPMQLVEGGAQTRSFIHVRDTVSGIATVMETGKVGEIYNVGDSNEMTIKDLGFEVARVLGVEPRFELVGGGYPARGCTRRTPNVRKLCQLGWRCERTLEEAIREIAAKYAEETRQRVVELYMHGFLQHVNDGV